MMGEKEPLVQIVGLPLWCWLRLHGWRHKSRKRPGSSWRWCCSRCSGWPHFRHDGSLR